MNGTDEDIRWIRHCIELSRQCVKLGNHPFGAAFVYEGKLLLEGLNSVCTDWDPTAHGEMNLLRAAGKVLKPKQLAEGTLYSSMEPCAMCAGAIHWLGMRRVVYGCGAGRLAGLTKNRLRLSCRDVFATSDSRIEVVGPLLEDEAFSVHAGFWNTRTGDQPGIYGM
jgi:tRNA(Arg) A34 adenosine deaminase TadA